MVETHTHTHTHSAGVILSAVMAESRRVQLTTLSCEAPLPTQPAPGEVKPPPGVVQEEKKCLDPPSEPSSVRLVLKLFDPDERSFPEFSYTRLLDNKVGFIPLF